MLVVDYYKGHIYTCCKNTQGGILILKFNEKLTKLRKANGYTQENLAEKLGVSRQAISRWEADETAPDMKMLLELCEVFNVSAYYLIHDDYASDEDIPAIKEKGNVIKTVTEKNQKMHLFAGIAFAITTMCGIIGIVTSESSAHLAIACFFTTILMGLCAAQFGAYFKGKK